MVKRTASGYSEEPEQKQFLLPSEKEHLFQVTDVDEEMSGDPDIVFIKCEVVGGDEEGRSLLQRLSLDDSFKGFFATRLFLKAIDEPYKGDNFPIDTENWIGRQFYATVIHNGKYANIKEYNFEKKIEQFKMPKSEPKKPETVAWDD